MYPRLIYAYTNVDFNNDNWYYFFILILSKQYNPQEDDSCSDDSVVPDSASDSASEREYPVIIQALKNPTALSLQEDTSGK